MPSQRSKHKKSRHHPGISHCAHEDPVEAIEPSSEADHYPPPGGEETVNVNAEPLAKDWDKAVTDIFEPDLATDAKLLEDSYCPETQDMDLDSVREAAFERALSNPEYYKSLNRRGTRNPRSELKTMPPIDDPKVKRFTKTVVATLLLSAVIAMGSYSGLISDGWQSALTFLTGG